MARAKHPDGMLAPHAVKQRVNALFHVVVLFLRHCGEQILHDAKVLELHTPSPK